MERLEIIHKIYLEQIKSMAEIELKQFEESIHKPIYRPESFIEMVKLVLSAMEMNIDLYSDKDYSVLLHNLDLIKDAEKAKNSILFYSAENYI